jgi:hypothetical protein
MGVVMMTLSMSLDGFITGPDPGTEQPLGTGGDTVLRPGGEPSMIEEVFTAAGATVVGRAMYDHVHGRGEDRVAGATTFTTKQVCDPVHLFRFPQSL